MILLKVLEYMNKKDKKAPKGVVPSGKKLRGEKRCR